MTRHGGNNQAWSRLSAGVCTMRSARSRIPRLPCIAHSTLRGAFCPCVLSNFIFQRILSLRDGSRWHRLPTFVPSISHRRGRGRLPFLLPLPLPLPLLRLQSRTRLGLRLCRLRSWGHLRRSMRRPIGRPVRLAPRPQKTVLCSLIACCVVTASKPRAARSDWYGSGSVMRISRSPCIASGSGFWRISVVWTSRPNREKPPCRRAT